MIRRYSVTRKWRNLERPYKKGAEGVQLIVPSSVACIAQTSECRLKGRCVCVPRWCVLSMILWLLLRPMLCLLSGI